MVRPPGSEMIYNDVTEKIGTAIDAAGAVITVAGAVIAFVVGAVRLSRRDSDVYRRSASKLGHPARPRAARGRRHRRHCCRLAQPHQRGGTGGDRPHPYLPKLLARGRDNRAMTLAKARQRRPL